MNDYQKARFTQLMVRRMFNTITGKRIAVFGFAFKKDTGDTRETPAVIAIVNALTGIPGLMITDYGTVSVVVVTTCF